MSDGAPVRRLIDRLPVGAPLPADAVLDRFLAWVGDQGLEPYPAQEEALLELWTGRHVVLSTPTGSGKSLVALGLHFKALAAGKRSFYTAPIKALVSEKFFDLCEAFGPENVGMLTGDASINWGAPVICCTAEILANMAVAQGTETDAPCVVMDEFHYYDDRERGIAWQIPLIALPNTQFLLMSATLGNTAVIEEKLRARSGREVAHVHHGERPVPLDYSWSETPLHETVERLQEQGKAPVYIVHFTQREAAEQAQALTSAKVASREERRAVVEAIGKFRFDSPYGPTMKRILHQAIGLHHAGLLPRYRLLVERLAQQGLLKVICGTDTLGVGVNVPIRTVLFTKLCKFDGEKTSLLSVREFKQIAGRAGRRGFDEQGSVVCQAPEHVIENKRIEAKAAGAAPGRRRKLVKKKAPEKGFVNWTEASFQERIDKLPEVLHSRFRVGHGLLVACLRGSGYGRLVELVAASHEEAADKRRLLREAAACFRALRGAGIVEVFPGPGGASVRVSEALQRDFSLHHTLSLYLVEALAALDREAESYALDVLALVEAILEDPRPILYAQERREKGRVIAELKAEGVPYEERIERLESVTWPKPGAEFIYATFDLFRERHPWVGSESIRPKGVAREMVEVYAGFDDYVKRTGLQRVEGVLLRYVSQVHGTLARSVPEAARSDEVLDILGYLRSLVAGVDSSLLQEWESLVEGARSGPEAPETPGPRRPRDPLADPRAFRARVRAELHQLVRALAAGAYEEAGRYVRQDAEDPWDAQRFEAELAPFFAEHARIVFEPRARQAEYTRLVERAPRLYDCNQVLLDDAGDNLWSVEGEIDLREPLPPEEPLVRLRRIGT